MTLTTSTALGLQPDFVEVVTPPPRVSVSVDNLHIVGRSSAAAIGVVLNEKDQGVVVVKDSVFHYHLDYGYGLNEVALIPLSADSQVVIGDTSLLEILFSPKISRRFRRIYPALQFHGVVDQEMCLECHRGATDSLGTTSDEDVCLDCHQDLVRQFSRHTEADDRTCVGCHPVEHGVTEGTAADAEENPCFRCHQDKIGEYAQEFIHGPVAGGGCVICHNPHGSQYDKNLHSPQVILCFSCHEDLDSELNREFVHEPFAEGNCVGCHDPHSTANKWVLIKTTEEVCINCHEELGTLKDHGHPYNVVPKNPLRVDLELTDRGVLECLSCHYAHASQAAHLLKIPGRFNCAACHDDKL
jgi:predicted CXXCH cytochrome family protein